MPAPDLPPPPAADHPRCVYVHLTPAEVEPEEFEGCCAVVIDVLRATTTMVAALHAGARCILPVLTVDDARAAFARLAPGVGVRGGERGGVRIEGFELDNSPRACTPAAVGGKDVVFTSTNGTAAILHAARARRVLVAGFANLMATCRAIVDEPGPVRIVCAGTRGAVSLEDALVAGAMVDVLSPVRPLSERDEGRLALEAWRCTLAQPGGLMRSMRASRGGRNLLRLGYDADVDFCAGIDIFPLVAEYDAATARVTRTDRSPPVPGASR
jgi:2-phosphosulfolactate phosphatase